MPESRELELSIVAPAFNEVGNVHELIQRIEDALVGVSWELIIVDDDSPDETAEVVRDVARRDRRIRCLQRIGRRGLSSACIEGVLSASAPVIAIMDADLQHDETLLPKMLHTLREEDLDLVIGSRYVADGSLGDLAANRAQISKFATQLSRMLLRSEVHDPLSGFFMFKRKAFHDSIGRLSGLGFKILLDFLCSSPAQLRFKELPFKFRPRFSGESKLDSHNAWDFGLLLIDKRIGRFVPVRFVSFCVVGGTGVLVHLAVLALLFRALDVNFIASQSLATFVAMSGNFVLNNSLTYRDMRLRGWGLLRGWIIFLAVCGFGAMANVGVAGYLYEANFYWLWSAMGGVIVGTVWNYAVTSMYTWKVTG